MFLTSNKSAIRSQREIMTALFRLMEQEPYKDISVKQILIEAKAARKTFYRNFTGKEDVLHSMVQNKISDYIEQLTRGNILSLEDALDAIFSFCQNNQLFFTVLAHNKLLHILQYELNKELPSFHKARTAHKHFFFQCIDDSEVDYVIYMNIGAIINVLILWIEKGQVQEFTEIKDVLHQFWENMSAGK